MYNEMNKTLTDTDLRLYADDDSGLTARYLQAGVQDLKSLSEGPMDKIGPGVLPSFESRTLQFKLVRSTDKRHFATLRWTDYPGEWLFPPLLSMAQERPETSQLRARLLQSPVLLIALYAPALCWSQGKLNDEVNRPIEVREIVNQWLSNKPTKRLVIFTPIKCERWVSTAQGRDLLASEVADANSVLLSDLREVADLRVMYMPVQTVGAVEFARYRAGFQGKPQAVFHGVPPHEYRPCWVRNPLKSVLIEVARQVDYSESFWSWLWGRNDAVKAQRREWLSEGFDESVKNWTRV